METDGLKQVRNRRHDALARVRWDRLEALLADYYAAHGYRVEHVGTGGTRRRFDGGIDLKLRKDDEYILVQCKGWNAYQVPHNEVHQLIGLMVNEGATGAILVTAGEFTRAAIEAAARGGHVQLVDGDDLREMLGPLPKDVLETLPSLDAGRGRSATNAVQRIAATAGDRLLSAAEDRIRYGRGKAGGVGRTIAFGLGIKLIIQLLAFLFFVLILYFAGRVFLSAVNSLSLAKVSPPTQQTAKPQPIIPAPSSELPASAEPQVALPPPREPTREEIRRAQSQADDAMKVIQDTTPEM